MFAAVMLAAAGTSSAADETATATLSMSPRSGTLYKEAPRPVNWRVEVEVSAPDSSPNVLPTKYIKAHFPKGMEFNPAPGTAICPEAMVGPPPVNLTIPPEQMIARCPDALVGNGKASLFLAQNNEPGALLNDPVLLAFNGGENKDGEVVLRIYAYSKAGGTGLYEEAIFNDGVMEVAIPQITGDSSTSIFDLNIPGTNTEHPEWNGVDPGYVRTTCATGTWSGFAELTLGSRNTAGEASGPEALVRTPDFTTVCEGEVGKARASVTGARGPGSVKKGTGSTFRVTVKNPGTATARGGKLSVSGRGVSGRSSIGSMKPGASRVVKVKAKFKRAGKVKASFKAAFKGIPAAVSVKRIKVT